MFLGPDLLWVPTIKGSGDTTLQQASSPKPQQSESAGLVPRSSALQEQGFFEEVAARIEAPQTLSTRAIYKSSGPFSSNGANQMSWWLPSIKQIADFLLHLFKERKMQPSTIEGYRMAIADMVGNDKLNISKDENLTRLLDSFHRDKPKGRQGVPTWNISLVLHQLTRLHSSACVRPLLNT